jgi:translation initiation factor IF-2
MPENNSRPPVVTILGHVDHGKTSLLDRIRNTSVASGEVGGITQAIGAYQIVYQGKKITFIDTPGHAAFSAMRKRGGQAADIALLIVAADDSVMPQTRESIEHIKEANIPYVVVVNKTDLAGVNPERVKTDLANNDVYVEGYGGNIPIVNISAKSGQGVEELLEIILLLAEMEDLKNNDSVSPASATVIESSMHPQKGPLATLLVSEGTFQKNQELFAGATSIGKIRSMVDYNGKNLNSAPPSTPFQVIGLSTVPNVGDIITSAPTIEQNKKTIKNIAGTGERSVEKPNIILKSDVQGSLEAILNTIVEYANVVDSSVGMVTDTDIQTAISTGAEILGFNVKINASVARLAEIEKVSFTNFKIIYQLFDYLKDLQFKKEESLGPKIVETGQLKVLKSFNFSGTIVYGCTVTSGKIKIGDKVNGSTIISLKSNKLDVPEVKKDQEFGLVIKPNLELKEGDIMTATEAQ